MTYEAGCDDPVSYYLGSPAARGIELADAERAGRERVMAGYDAWQQRLQAHAR
jgi:hypothetical protein